LKVKSLPAYHLSNADVYIAGSFNSWRPHDEKYKLQRNDSGDYFINLKLDKGTYEYKITRGGWDKVETKIGGAGIENRNLKVESDTTIQLTIEDWADRFRQNQRLRYSK
jgi:alpha-glucosidase